MKVDIKCTLTWKGVEVTDKKDKEELNSWNGEGGFEWSDFAANLLEKQGLDDSDADFHYEIEFLDESDEEDKTKEVSQ